MQFIRGVLAFLFSMGLTLVIGLGLVRAAGGPTGQEVSIKAQGSLARNDQAVTSENRSDLDITAAIRRALAQDDTLSRNARNIKITTHESIVTLQGPVDSPTEKSRIDQLAHQIKGVKQIENRLEANTGRQANLGL